MMLEDEPAGDDERSAALDGWVAAFDREMEQRGDFAAGVAAMTAHGCFDVRAVVERWILANPTGDAMLAPLQPALRRNPRRCASSPRRRRWSKRPSTPPAAGSGCRADVAEARRLVVP